jgi:hypothetical protein
MGTNNPNATRDQYGDLVRLQVSGRRLITEDRENALLLTYRSPNSNLGTTQVGRSTRFVMLHTGTRHRDKE